MSGGGHFNAACFNAGIIQGMLDAAQYPAEVTAHFTSDTDPRSTVYVILFESATIANRS
jgi:hypothetical protein